MFTLTAIDYISLARPIVFLCGPFYDEKNPRDRRGILAKWINKNWVEKGSGSDKIHAFPIIIETILNSAELDRRNIKANLAEEILSRISYATYVFLDTMSSSYEYGQFSNYAYNTNLVRVFLDNEHKTRVLCQVGAYLEKNIENRTKYEAQYNGQGHIFFKGDKVPPEIITAISPDNPCHGGYTKEHKLQFVSREKATGTIGEFSFVRDGGAITFFADAKTWFYFMSAVQYRFNFRLDQITSKSDIKYLRFIHEVKIELIRSFVSHNTTGINNVFMLLWPLTIDIVCPPFPEEEFPYYVAVLLGLISSRSNGSTQLKHLSSYTKRTTFGGEGAFSNDSIFDFFLPRGLCLLRTVTRSNMETRYGMCSKTLAINGKARNLVCYKNDKYGRDLRRVHELIGNYFLRELPTSKHSFAYKEGENTLSCLKQHEGNVFFAKFDIKEYFHSITLSKTVYKISNLVAADDEEEKEGRSLFRFNRDVARREIRQLLFPLFFDGRLPLGYINSPKISDFFLYSLDEKMERIKGVTYTRYADDILLSSKSKEILDSSIGELRGRILDQKLVINEDKTLKKSLLHEGDSIRFLGINLVKRKGGFEYTISRQYLIETSKMIGRAIKRKSPSFGLKVFGRINYIRYVSEVSFARLKKLVEIKLGYLPNAYFSDEK